MKNKISNYRAQQIWSVLVAIAALLVALHYAFHGQSATNFMGGQGSDHRSEHLPAAPSLRYS